jgi:twitching motility protein PilT
MPCDLVALLTFAKEEGASDLHVSSGLPPLLRLRGSMVRLDMPALTPQETHDAIRRILTDDHRRIFEDRHELDFGFEIPGVSRFRANVFVQARGEAIVCRLVPNQIKSLEELGMPGVLKELALKEKGLVVVTGPTGSGKSTTLAALVDFVNQSKSAHIVTIEDPIEFVHESKKCLVNQREVGAHTKSFAGALRAALREDPDIILVGELRDLETTSLAISAAETGHLVFATLHTNSAAKTIDRIIDIFPGDQQSQVRTMLSESLEGVIAQTLMPTKDGTSRVAAVEILIGVPALRNLIREDKTAQIQSVIQTGAVHGMQSIDQCLRELVKQGLISRADAVRKSGNPRLFEEAPVGGPAGAPQAAGPSPGAGAAGPGPRKQPRPGESPIRPGLTSR